MTQAIITIIIFLAIGFYTFYGYLKSLRISMQTLLLIYGVSFAAMITGFILMWQRQVENYSIASQPINIFISLSLTVFLALLFSTVIYFIADIIRFFRWGLTQLANFRIMLNKSGFLTV